MLPGPGSAAISISWWLIERQPRNFVAALAPDSYFVSVPHQIGASLPRFVRQPQRDPSGMIVVVEDRTGDVGHTVGVDEIEMIAAHELMVLYAAPAVTRGQGEPGPPQGCNRYSEVDEAGRKGRTPRKRVRSYSFCRIIVG